MLEVLNGHSKSAFSVRFIIKIAIVKISTQKYLEVSLPLCIQITAQQTNKQTNFPDKQHTWKSYENNTHTQHTHVG